MSPQERRGTLWDLRYQTFGKDALEIWEAALKAERIADALETIGQQHDTSVDDKLDLYLDVVRSTWGDRAEQFIQQRQTELMSRFLSVETVQDELHAMPPEQRRAALREVRRRMGLDDEALRRWDELDALRDRNWEAGRSYMRERERVLSGPSGPEQQRRLDELRLRHFGEEAEIIRSEEEAGFLRFGHPRMFGKE